MPALFEGGFDLVDDRTEVHDHLTVLGLDVPDAFALAARRRAACARASVGLLPERCELVRLHEPKRDVMDDALDAVGDGRRRDRRLGGKHVGQLSPRGRCSRRASS